MLRHEEDASISINIKPWKKYYAKKCNSKKSNLLLSPHFFEPHELEIIASRLPKRSDLLHKTNRMMSLEKNVEPTPNESLRSKLRRISQYTMEDLEAILKLFQPGSFLYIRTFQLISFLKTREIRLLKLPKQDTTCYFSDLTEEQLMPSFAEVAKFRFVLCKVLLTYNSDDAKPRTYYKGHSACPYTYDLPKGTAHGTMVGSGHQLFGSIQAAAFSLDPASPPFNIFNHKYNDPIAVPKLGFLSPHCICYCSIPFSTSVKIAANLHVTTDKVDDVDTKEEYRSSFKTAHEKQFNDAFEICNGSAVINSSDCFAKRPNGGSYSYTLNGRDGHLKLYYLALKYVVDAALEVVFVATCEETKVAGRVMAYYGKKFDYGCSPAELDDYKALLFETEQPELKRGKINLVRSVLSVPSQFSLIIDANLTDSNSGAIILSGVYEFFVPTDGGIRVGRIEGNDCSLELKVDWKLPPFAEETTLDKRSYYSDLTEKQVFSQRSSVTQDEEDGRWSLQKEISLPFSYLLEGNFSCDPEVSVSISTGTEADDCDYLCTSVLNIWPELRSFPFFRGPKCAGLDLKDTIALLPQAAGMVERCVVGGPGFLKFNLSRTWIAESICEMIDCSIFKWAPKLPIETAIIHILPRNIAKEMHMGHLQSAIIGETLARVLEYSKVRVHRRFHYGDYLDIESKMKMTEFLIDRFPNGEVNDQAIGDVEVLYEESSKKFAEDAEFRERTQPVQDWDERHKSAWEQICTISQKRYRKVYQRLGIHVKEEGKILHGSYIRKTRKLLRKEGYNTKSGDEAIVIEGRKLRLVDFAALWPSLELGKVDRIVHVADVGQRDKIEMCITVAESVGCRVTNQCHDPLSHVGYVQVKGFEGYGLVQLLDEAKSRCKAVLVGKAGEELKHTAEALGYGAVKYEVLKNNRLTDYSFSFDDMLKEMGNTAVYLQKTHARICSSMENIRALAGNLLTLKGCLTLKDDRERELGLHLLRFTEVLGEVCRVLAPHILCDYLFVLCDKFNGLYSDSRHRQVLRSDEDSKILLFQATRVVIAKCFEFLGITPIYDNFSTIK